MVFRRESAICGPIPNLQKTSQNVFIDDRNLNEQQWSTWDNWVGKIVLYS